MADIEDKERYADPIDAGSALDRELTENAAQFARIVLSYFDDDELETVL